MSEAAKKRPKRTLSQEQKEKISLSLIGNCRAEGNVSNRKKVAMCDENNNIIKIFEYAGEGADYVKCNPSGINRACRENENFNDLDKTRYGGFYCGYKWFYLDENMELKIKEVYNLKKNKRNSPLEQYSLNGEKLRSFDTIKEAAIENNISINGLIFALRKVDSVKYKGFLWVRKI